MGYKGDAATKNCYEGTTCLINKLNIKDERVLSQIEAEITFAKISELERNPIKGNFDFEHYKAIHKFLFEDLYDWAGTLRTIDISKKATSFVKANQIEELADKCFLRLKNNNYFKNNSFDKFVENIADFYITTNMLHPFREGNGRTQRVFLSQLIRNAGYDIDFSKIDTDELMIATIHSANGIDSYLIEFFKQNIIKQK